MLHVPVGSNQFGLMLPSTTARPNAGQGTQVTPAIGSKGSWVEVIASTSHDLFGILININTNTSSASSRNSTCDIGIGAASSETVFIADLLCGNAAPYNVIGNWYYFPIFIKAGTRIAARGQSTVTTAFRVYIQGMGQPSNPAQIRKASFVETIGITAPNAVSVTGGTTSDGAWTLIGTTTNRTWWWQFGVQISSSDVTHGANVQHVDIAVGDSTTKVPIITDAQFTTATTEQQANPPFTVGCEFPVAAGTEVYARIQSNGTPDPYQIAVYAAGG